MGNGWMEVDSVQTVQILISNSLRPFTCIIYSRTITISTFLWLYMCIFEIYSWRQIEKVVLYQIYSKYIPEVRLKKKLYIKNIFATYSWTQVKKEVVYQKYIYNLFVNTGRKRICISKKYLQYILEDRLKKKSYI